MAQVDHSASAKHGLERFQLRTVTINREPNTPFGFVLKGRFALSYLFQM